MSLDKDFPGYKGLGARFDDDLITEVICDVGKNNVFRLLIDTGATISLVQISSIKGSTMVNQNERVKINGIFGSNKTYGTCEAAIGIGGVNFEGKFQVVPAMFESFDGILGRDFLRNRAVIDCIRKEIRFPHIIDELGKSKGSSDLVTRENKGIGGQGFEDIIKKFALSVSGLFGADSIQKKQEVLGGLRGFVNFANNCFLIQVFGVFLDLRHSICVYGREIFPITHSLPN